MEGVWQAFRAIYWRYRAVHCRKSTSMCRTDTLDNFKSRKLVTRCLELYNINKFSYCLDETFYLILMFSFFFCYTNYC